MEQPKSYDKQEDLIAWFYANIRMQRILDVQEYELVFNIGNSNIESEEKIEIDFNFNFIEILKKLGDPKKDEKGNTICPYNIRFSNCTFNHNVYFTNIDFQQDVIFSDIDFKQDVIFKNASFNKNVILNDVVFNQVVNFSYTDFNQVVDFTGVIFEKNVIVENTNFNGYTLFESVEFKTFENPEDKNNKRLFKTVNFKEITCCNSYMRNIIFEKCNFEELNVYKLGVDINNFLYPTKWDTNNFTHCEFKKLLLGKSIIIDCIFNKSIIVEEADFYKHPLLVNINNLLDISTTIDNTKFIEVDFQEEGDFKTVVFEKQVEFVRCRFGNRGAFWGSSFDILTFENIRLEDKSHIYFGGTKGNILELVNSVLLGRIDFNNDNIKKLNLFGSVVRRTLNRIKFKAVPANWGTAVVLKHECIKRSNTIEALEYKAIEKDLYTIELKKNIKENKSKIKELKKSKENKKSNKIEIKRLKKEKRKYCFDKMSLCISRLSNNHGQSWQRAVLFTFIVWMISFGLFYTTLILSDIMSDKSNFLNIGYFLANLIEYFIPTNYNILSCFLKIDTYNCWLKLPAILFYMFGKIFIPYGVFEIIQAFRKYNKVS